MVKSVDAVGKALDDLRAGKFVLVFDAEGREEETDMCVASQFVTPEAVRTLRKDAGGWICTTIPPRMLDNISMPTLSEIFLSAADKYPFVGKAVPGKLPYDQKSAFSLTISHNDTYTGVTDNDRALTIRRFAEFARNAIAKENGWAVSTFAKEFRVPGHVALLRPSLPLFLSRRGHTELTTALASMAKVMPSATICEMLGDDGRALSRPEAKEYALAHNLTFLEGREIVEAWRIWSE